MPINFLLPRKFNNSQWAQRKQRGLRVKPPDVLGNIESSPLPQVKIYSKRDAGGEHPLSLPCERAVVFRQMSGWSFDPHLGKWAFLG